MPSGLVLAGDGIGPEVTASARSVLASVDKANVLSTGVLWKSIATELAPAYPDVAVEHLLVDNAAIQLLLRVATFDVVVTGTLFGDLLSDESRSWLGGLGMLPSGSFGTDGPALYEPAHGTAPDIAGRGLTNPSATILPGAMLLRHSLEDDAAAAVVERAVYATLSNGIVPRDLGGTATTEQVTAAVLSRL